MKKLFSTLLISVLCFNIFNISNSFADNSKNKSLYIKDKIIINNSLSKTVKGKNYIKIVDKFIEQHKNSSNKLEILKTKTDKLLDNPKIKNKILLDTLKYLNIKASIALLELEDEILTPSISEEDKKIVEEKIIKLQLNLLEKTENILETLTKEFEKQSSYEESGDLEMNLNVDIEKIGKIDSNIKLNNYEAITNNLDSKIKGDLSLMFEAISNGDEIELKLNTFVDLISKDGGIFILLKDLNIIEDKGLEDIKTTLDKLKEIAIEKKYIKFEDSQSKASLELLKSLNPSKIIGDAEIVLAKSFFEAYKKDGEKFYIKPTKYACDKFKETANKFDPFNGSSCSDSQYEDLLKEINEFGSFYISFNGELSTIGFEGKLQDDLEENKGHIIFSDKEIEEFSYSIRPDQEEYYKEGFEIFFKNKESFNLNFLVDQEKINLISSLDNNNRFKSANFIIDAKDGKMDIKLKNKKLSGDFEIINKGYDSATYSYIEKNKIIGTISGETNYNNEFKDFEIEYKGTSIIDNKEYLNGTFGINGSKFTIINNYTGDSFLNNISIIGEIDSKYIISNLDLDIDIKQKKGTYNYETWEYVYDEDFSDLFISKITVDNRDINGYTNIYYMDSSIEIDHKGNYTNESFKLDNSYIVKSQFLNDYDGEVNGNLNVDIDMENNKNNMDFLFNILSGNTQIINLKIENNGSRYQKEVEIKTPTNTIDFEEVFGNDY